jgi:hypothetical protein
MESNTQSTDTRPLLSRQPLKGIAFTLLSFLGGAAMWLLLRGAFSLDYGSGSSPGPSAAGLPH